MAACSDPEEKPSSPKEPPKISSENTVNHEMRKNCYNELSNHSKNHENFSEIPEKSNPEVSKLSDDEFLQLMIEASTFNKSSKQESALLKKLRIDNPITETEPSDKAKLRTQFPAHHKATTRNNCIGNNSSFPSGASHSRLADGRKKHSRNNKDDGQSKSALNALQKGIHQSQSLQDLMSSDLTKSRQRSRKAHRTHSLSSDEVDPESLALLKRLGKKSHKGEANKSNDSGDGRRNGLSNHCSGGGSAGNSSPVEIEMEEMKSEKGAEEGEESNGANSKFYVDCNDIDSTVSFPLKLVSSMDDQNNELVGDQLKRFPIVPWPRPLQVQSFFSSLPMDTDSFSSNDKQILNADINGNPFTRNTRPSNLASFVSSTLMDYSSSSALASSETNKNRKNKRLKNALVNKGVLSENIAGHRGEEDIDSLLQFINSSDKKAKSAVKGSSSQVISAKSSLLHDKKSFGKEMKNCHKNVIGVVKKGLKRSSSLENISSSKISDSVSDVFLFDSRDSSAKDSETRDEDSTGKVLDINSNEEDRFGEKASLSESSLHNSSPEVSSFAADFYSTADVSSQTVEESGFSIVKKKQRKKHQGKRSESFRWRNAQAQRKKGMMLPLAESKCGKQDTRRKSTSSVPHSDHSSADNSDLDSVHSLPVSGSVPHPKQPHPHTTPSSSSSTPQASYADIARMPISKQDSPPRNPQEHDIRRTEHEIRHVEHGVRRTEQDIRQQEHDMRRTEHEFRLQEHGVRRMEHDTRLQDHDLRRTEHEFRQQEHCVRKTEQDVRQQEHDIRRTEPEFRQQEHGVRRTEHDTRSQEHDVRRTEQESRPIEPDSRRAEQDTRPQEHGIRRTEHDARPQEQDFQHQEHNIRRTEHDAKPQECNARRVAEPLYPKHKTLPDAKESPRPMIVAPDAASCSVDAVKVRSHTKSTREINTQTEPENVSEGRKGEESSKSECASCSSRKSACSCSRFHVGTRSKTKSGGDIPPVIMDNMPPESNACNVSFGFGIEEVLQMDPEDTSFDLGDGQEVFGADSGANSRIDNVDLCSKLELQASLRPAQTKDISPEQSSHLTRVCYGTGRNLCYNETKVNAKRFNHSEVTHFLGNEFHSIENEIKGISRSKTRAEYYVDSSEEA